MHGAECMTNIWKGPRGEKKKEEEEKKRRRKRRGEVVILACKLLLYTDC